ncbi:MAG: hypothetical protein EBX37_16785 [Alphaproteobacteria bacterium]|nr:hypothetical protein [Alphaproteobacteria bacterium]
MIEAFLELFLEFTNLRSDSLDLSKILNIIMENSLHIFHLEWRRLIIVITIILGGHSLLLFFFPLKKCVQI